MTAASHNTMFPLRPAAPTLVSKMHSEEAESATDRIDKISIKYRNQTTCINKDMS
jgi:hypothetical protein